jgi:sugar O-acyltransferase (sialic acid O-acetyltransferase NeuD family)
MATPLILIAASGLAREALAASRAASSYDVIGFVDDDPARHGELIGGVKVLGGLDVVRDHPDAAVVICIGRGAAREAIALRLGIDASRYATVVHPSVAVPESCSLGPGSIVLGGCVLTADITVGRHVVLMPHVTLTHDDIVADYATLCASVTLGGFVHVGQRSYLGMSSSVRERVRIGADAIVGMGGVVLNDVVPGTTVVGVPARSRPPSSRAYE